MWRKKICFINIWLKTISCGKQIPSDDPVCSFIIDLLEQFDTTNIIKYTPHTLRTILTLSSRNYPVFFNQDVDLLVTGMTISAARASAVDFSYMFWEDKLGMLTGTLQSEPFYMFNPLHKYVWLSFTAAVLTAAVTTACYENCSMKMRMTSMKGYLRPVNVFWYTFAAMWNRGKFNLYLSLKIWTLKIQTSGKHRKIEKNKRGYKGKIDFMFAVHYLAENMKSITILNYLSI